jgi:hypothetical protein
MWFMNTNANKLITSSNNASQLNDVIHLTAHPEREAVEGFCAYNPSTSSG